MIRCTEIQCTVNIIHSARKKPRLRKEASRLRKLRKLYTRIISLNGLVDLGER